MPSISQSGDDSRSAEQYFEYGFRNSQTAASVQTAVDEAKPVAPHRATILSIGDDERLLETRHMVLASAGYAVLSIGSAAPLDERRVSQINLVVICHSVFSKRAAHVAETLHRIHLALPILRLGDSGPETDGSYELTFDFPPTPEVLLRTVERLLSGRTDSRNANNG